MPDYFHQAIAQMMYEELLFRRLVVSLAPSGLQYQPTERKRRVVEERNPAWYRELCRLYQSNGRSRQRKKKHGDTLVKREHTLRALLELAAGRCQSEYAHRLRPFVEREARRFWEQHHRSES